jgi:hypothetical protein
VPPLLLFLALAADGPLGFQGIGLDTDLLSLTVRFPHSQHEFWKGVITTFRNERDQFRELVLQGTGDYVARLTPLESVAHLYYFQARVVNGVWTSLRLSFERPYGEGVASPIQYREHPLSRSPLCTPFLRDLTREYGKPAGPESSKEEALESLTYTWARPEGRMSLVCGRYDDHPMVFAEHIDLVPSR